MMFEKPVDKDKCCFCIELKTACYLIAYSLLFSEILGAGLLVYLCIDDEEVWKMLDVDPVNYWGSLTTLTLAIAMVLIVALVMISFTIVLIIGLYKDDIKHIRIFLIFFTITYTITFLFFFAFDLVLGTDPTGTPYRWLSVVIHGFFLYVIVKYSIKIHSNTVQLYQNS